MTDLTINFSYPWLLLLLLPAAALALIPYFRTAKKYRRTRNRITSLVLQLIVSVLAVGLLAGLTFDFRRPNDANEMLLLVDMSYSGGAAEDDKNNFVRSVLEENDSEVQIGVVTFGYGNVYAARMDSDADKVFEEYLEAPRPDDSATDIASALIYASELFERPETAKIVLLTDGVETEGKADGETMAAIAAVASKGIKVDAVYFPEQRTDRDAWISGVEMPDITIVVGDEVNIQVVVRSNFSGPANLTLLDNDVADGEPLNVDLHVGENIVTVAHRFAQPGAHELYFQLNCEGDALEENNGYYTYLFLEVFNKILIVDGGRQSDRLSQIMSEGNFETQIVGMDELPDSLEELRQYDQVVFMNVANADLPQGFDEILYEYVYELGGGLFTVGGDKAFDRNDLRGTVYQDMLPVEAIDYTPPLGLVIIIDRSGSMSTDIPGLNKSRLDLAKEGAASCVNVLSERDYVGVISLDDGNKTEVAITPVPEKNKVLNAIMNISSGGNTAYSGAIQLAGTALQALPEVAKRHILFVSDGQPGDRPDQYEEFITHFYKNVGITMSTVYVGGSSATNLENMRRMANLGGGEFFDASRNPASIPQFMREDVQMDEITEYNPEPFQPEVGESTPVLSGVKEEDIPILGGFYGVKTKAIRGNPVSVSLVGPYGAPIYAQWNFGKGKVGSFMCDLSGGEWSEEFTSDDVGIRLINNIIKGLFPTESLLPREIDVRFEPDNYRTEITVFTELDEGETVRVTMTAPSGKTEVQTLRRTENSYLKTKFTFSAAGVYKFKAEKISSDGTVLSEYTAAATFSYSEEYMQPSEDENYYLAFLTDIASGSSEGGMIIPIGQADLVFRDFDKILHTIVDPRVPLAIAAIVLFLLDIAVRKFKWKWPWEIVRDRKERKMLADRSANKQ